MRIHLVAIGKRMPSWISDGFSEYAQRLRSGVKLELIEVETPRRGSNVDLSRVVREEGARLLRGRPLSAHTGLHSINPGAVTIPNRWRFNWKNG